MGSVEDRARELLAAEYQREGIKGVEPEVFDADRAALRAIAAALREQSEARGVVDGAPAFQRWSMARGSDGKRWSVYMDHDQHGEWVKWVDVQQHFFGLALTAAQQPVQEGGGECPKCRDTGEVCTGYIDGTPEMFDCTCPAAARPQDVALLPLPEIRALTAYAESGQDIRVVSPAMAQQYASDYARANVTAALASAQAREEELRALLGGVECQRDANWQAYTEAEARAERLEEALRDGLSGLNGLFASGDYPLTDEVVEIGLAIIGDMQAALSTNAATQTGE